MIKPISNKGNYLNSTASEKEPGAWRLWLLAALLMLCALTLAGRLIQLHISHTDFLRAQGNARTLRVVDIPSFRGMVTDRRGTPIAISSPVHSVWINPQHFEPTTDQLTTLAKLLALPEEIVLKKANASRGFVYLKRGIPPDLAEKIQALNVTGVGLKREFRRYYPSGRQTAQLVGFTDIDDQGQAGIELTFEEYLKPIIGKKRVLEDRTGRWVKDIDHLRTPRSGQDVTLSIDLRIQSIAYQELEKALKEFKAKSATLTMLDVRTGEVLAMVSAPSFNPNNRQECNGSATRNRALTDLFEPGSTLKTISIACALASRQFTPETIIDTNPGSMLVNNKVVRDHHNYGVLNLGSVLSKSSNVGITKIMLALPKDQLIHTLRSLGLGDSINTPFPGERRGTLPTQTTNDFSLATLAFGYGLAVTPLQLVHAYSALATHGNLLPVSLTKVTNPQKIIGKQALPSDVADTTLKLLTAVISKEGTGARAHIPGFKTAGKTGTTRVVGPNGYDPNRHVGIFIGITPVDSPRLATIVIIEEPDEANYYGGLVAAPVYRNVVGKALHILNIAPDDRQG